MPGLITRRQVLARGAAMCGAVWSRRAFPYAASPACLQGARIRWIVGFSPGGGFDTYSRLAEPFIENALGAQIAIDNVPGAGGMVGALTLARARPDGRTLGILNGSGLLWDRNSDPVRDFTLLARISQRQQLVVGNVAAGVRTLEDLIGLSRRRAIVAGATAPTSSNFASLAALSDLLGLRTEYVTGYPGSREAILGLLRGDCDVTCMDIESFPEVAGEERASPLLQVTPEDAADRRLAEVPHLTGPAGLAAARPELFAGAPAHIRSITAAMSAYLEFGRLVAGPGGLAPALRDCLEQGLQAALADDGFAAAARRAGRSIDVATGAAVRNGLPAVLEAVRAMAPVIAAAAGRIR